MKVLKDLLVFLAIMAVGCWLCVGIGQLRGILQGGDTISVRIDSVRDTLYIEKWDTVPHEVERKVVQYVEIPVCLPADSVSQADIVITLPVVQKTFSDDSTYTAYVSGMEYDGWPKLDSIAVRQQVVTNTIHETVTIGIRKRWTFGIQAGAGFGIIQRKPDIYIGAGVQYNF